MSDIWALRSRMGNGMRLPKVATLSSIMSVILLGCGTEESAAPQTSGSSATTSVSSATTSEAPRSLPKPDVWDEVRISAAFDTGSTYEGFGNEFSINEPVGLDQIIADSELAVRARVAQVHPSELNTASGAFEITEEQRAGDKSVPPLLFDPRTRVDVQVLEVLGVRPGSPVQPTDEMEIDIKGGAVVLTMPQEVGERLRLYDPRDTDSGETLPPPPDGMVEATVSQPMGLHWTEGDEVVVFLTQNDVVLATFTAGAPDTRFATTITLDPAGAFRVRDGLALPNREVTTLASVRVEALAEAAQALASSRPATVPSSD